MEEKSAEEDAKGGAMIKVCGPVEMKGILGIPVTIVINYLSWAHIAQDNLSG